MQRVPLAAGTQDKEHRIQGLTIITTGPMAPLRVQLPWGKQPLEAFPPRVRHAPIPMYCLVVGAHRTGSGGREFWPIGYPHDRLLS